MTSEDGARYSKSNAWLYRLGQDFMTGSSDIRHEQISMDRAAMPSQVRSLFVNFDAT